MERVYSNRFWHMLSQDHYFNILIYVVKVMIDIQQVLVMVLYFLKNY